MDRLTNKGYENIIEAIFECTGAQINRQFIDDNYNKLSMYFETKEEGQIRRANHPAYDGDDLTDTYWTFEAESNTGGIWDTEPRDCLIDGFAQALVEMDWPKYCDTDEYKEKFHQAFQKAVDENPDVQLPSEV